MNKAVLHFLKRHVQPGSSLLLGYSGGPDSKALLYLLLACRAHFNFDLHLAHVDHGWREESAQEAEILAKEAAEHQLSFHLLTLKNENFKQGNLEKQARDYRIAFFSKIYSELQCQALLLAHQADDQAETVLKRVCEGAHLMRLGGLSEVTTLENMRVLRPLLAFKKKQLTSWLEERSLRFFEDPTNQSAAFLRGRMRTELLPLLAKGFGKEVVDNFCYLGRMAEGLKAYFMKKVAPHLENCISKGCLDIPEDVEEMELHFLLKEWFAREDISLSREALHDLIYKALAGKGSAHFPAKGGNVYINNGRLLVLK